MFPSIARSPVVSRAAAIPPPVAPRRAPNWWVPGRVVRFVPTMVDGLRLIGAPTEGLEAVEQAAAAHGWPCVTWRTTRLTAGFHLPEESLGRYAPAGDLVVAIVRMEQTTHRRGEHAIYFGDLDRGSMRQDAVRMQCSELESIGLASDIWRPLTTTL